MSTPAFIVTYDYRCPFANVMHGHIMTAQRAGANFDVTFAPWSLTQGHGDDGDLDVWNDPSREDDIAALTASVSVRDLQPDRFLDAHMALFAARHERGVRLNTLEEVVGVLREVGVDVDSVLADLSSRRPHEVLAASHHRFEKYEAFGVPTFVVDDDAVFVRYMHGPTADAQASIDLVRSIVDMIANQPDLNEFKHTRLPA